MKIKNNRNTESAIKLFFALMLVAMVSVTGIQPVFRPAFHAEVVKDQQRITTKAGNVLVAPLKAGGKVIEDKDVYKRQMQSSALARVQ